MPWKTMIVLEEDLQCSQFVFITLILVSISNNRFPSPHDCPFCLSFLPSLPFEPILLSSTWYYGIRSSFIKIPDPFRLGDLLSIYNLWSLQLTLRRINLCVCLSIFPTILACVR